MSTTVTSEWSDPVAFSVKSIGTNFAEQGKLPDPGVSVGDYFGQAVAISGDGTVALVSAIADRTLNSNKNGAVYYYTRSGGVWTKQSKITLAEAASTTYFGYGLALNYDGTKALMTVSGKTNTYTVEGTVLVYTRSGNTWTRGDTILAPDPKASKYFGTDVALNKTGDVAVIGCYADPHYGTNTGSAYVFKLVSGTWTYHQKLYTYHRDDLQAAGSGVAISGDGKTVAVNSGSAAGGGVTIFTLVDDLYVEQTIIGCPDQLRQTASTGDLVSGLFGAYAIALSDDGTVMAVGAIGDKTSIGDGTTYSGSVYIYRRQNSTWVLVQKLYQSDAIQTDMFGNAVALTGDGLTLLVGNSGRSACLGTVYDFEFAGTGLNEVAAFYSTTSPTSPTSNGEQFGTQLAISADGKLAVVTMPGDNSQIGMVSTYRRSGDSWYYETYMKGVTGDGTGPISVAVSGDGNIVFIGFAVRSSNQGVVLAYDYRNADLTTVAQTLNGTVANGYFGASLTTNNTGSVLVVGSPGNGSVTGAAQVYTGSISAGWTQQQVISDPAANATDHFATTVSLSNDGTKAVIRSLSKAYTYEISGSSWTLRDTSSISVSASLATSTAISSDALTMYVGRATTVYPPVGTVEKYTRTAITGNWISAGYLASKTIDYKNKGFGTSLALAADGSVLLVGVPQTYGSSGTYVTGSVAVFVNPTLLLANTVSSHWNARYRLTDSFAQASSNFGYSIAMSDDGNTAVIGAFQRATATADKQGGAYVYTRNGTRWDLVTELLPVTHFLNPACVYGIRCAISGDGKTIAVSASSNPVNGVTGQGQVFVFVKKGSVWVQEAALTNSDGTSNDYFGSSMALTTTGDKMVVGANNKTVTYTAVGRAYIFTRSSGNWTQYGILNSPTGTTNGRFGSSVAISGDGTVIAVGAPSENTAGQVHVWYNSAWRGPLGPDVLTTALFGSQIEMSDDGKKLFIAAPQDGGASKGAVWYFDTTDKITWTRRQKIRWVPANNTPVFSTGQRPISCFNGGNDIVVTSQYAIVHFTLENGSYVAKDNVRPNDLMVTGPTALAASSDGSVVLAAAPGGVYLNAATGVVNAYYKGDIAYGTTEKRTIVPRQKVFGNLTTAVQFGAGIAVDAFDTYMLVGRSTSSGNQITYYKKVNGYWQYVSEFAISGAVNLTTVGQAIAMTPDGTVAVVGESGYTGGGCFYLLTRSGDTWTQVSRIVPSPAISGQDFGYSIAVSGNITALNVIVGAPNDNTKATGAGSIYRFTYNGSTWTQKTKYYAAAPAANYGFGVSVALSDDGNWLVVGEHGATVNSKANAGQVHVFKYSGNGYAFAETIIARDAQDGSAAVRFGKTVAVSRDKAHVIVIGASGATSKVGLAHGVNYVYVRSGFQFMHRGTYGAEDTYNVGSNYYGKTFGANAITGELTTTGLKVYTGASGDMERGGGSAVSTGAFYVTDLRLLKSDVAASTSLVQVDRLIDIDGLAANEYFGCSVAVTRDGTRAVVGLFGKTATQTNQGGLIIYTKVSDKWLSEGPVLVANDPELSDYLGYRVAISDDGATVIAGAYNKNRGGAVYVFTRSGVTWSQQAKLVPSGASNGDYVGYSVSLSSDGNKALIGAPNKTVTYSNQGAAYVFTRSGSTWTQQAQLIASDPSSTALFGRSVAINSTGTTAIIGAYGKAGSYTNQGAAYAFFWNGSSWSQQSKFVANDPAAQDYFGQSVAVSNDGNTALIGAYNKTGPAGTQQGAVYVFVRSGTTWAGQTKLSLSDGVSGDSFGWCIALSADGNVALIGAYTKDSSIGAAYVFVRSGSVWTQTSKLVPNDAETGDGNFGYSVALSSDGTLAMVGAYVKNTGSVGNAGAVYTFADLSTHPEYQ